MAIVAQTRHVTYYDVTATRPGLKTRGSLACVAAPMSVSQYSNAATARVIGLTPYQVMPLLRVLVLLAAAGVCRSEESACQDFRFGGKPECRCVSSYSKFNVSNSNRTGHLTVSIPDTECENGCDYGAAYGLSQCASHDAGTAPYCDVAGACAGLDLGTSG